LDFQRANAPLLRHMADQLPIYDIGHCAIATKSMDALD
jgi:hypothetical protein